MSEDANGGFWPNAVGRRTSVADPLLPVELTLGRSKPIFQNGKSSSSLGFGKAPEGSGRFVTTKRFRMSSRSMNIT